MKTYHLKELDTVLKILSNIPDYSVLNEYIKTEAVKIDKSLVYSNVQLVLDKLVRDEYVELNEPVGPYDGNNKSKRRYQITFEGLVFIEQGGYNKQLEITNKDLTRSKYFNWAIAIGGGTATVYYGLEILHHYFEPIWQHACNCQFIWQK